MHRLAGVSGSCPYVNRNGGPDPLLISIIDGKFYCSQKLIPVIMRWIYVVPNHVYDGFCSSFSLPICLLLLCGRHRQLDAKLLTEGSPESTSELCISVKNNVSG